MSAFAHCLQTERKSSEVTDAALFKLSMDPGPPLLTETKWGLSRKGTFATCTLQSTQALCVEYFPMGGQALKEMRGHWGSERLNDSQSLRLTSGKFSLLWIKIEQLHPVDHNRKKRYQATAVDDFQTQNILVSVISYQSCFTSVKLASGDVNCEVVIYIDMFYFCVELCVIFIYLYISFPFSFASASTEEMEFMDASFSCLLERLSSEDERSCSRENWTNQEYFQM